MVSIELSPNGGFLLTIESMTVQGTHTIEIPASMAGIKVLTNILHARETASEWSNKIGSKASPTQQMIDEWLKANKATPAAPVVPKGRKYDIPLNFEI
jgi:hypothetical protein